MLLISEVQKGMGRLEKATQQFLQEHHCTGKFSLFVLTMKITHCTFSPSLKNIRYF
jgi:hypothetical protein